MGRILAVFATIARGIGGPSANAFLELGPQIFADENGSNRHLSAVGLLRKVSGK